jgi:hypothetical protein
MIDLSKLITAEQKAANLAQAIKEVRAAELKKLLLQSDYKVLPDYDKPVSDDLLTQRQAWRDEIRSLEV